MLPHTVLHRRSLIIGWLSLLLAIAVYCIGLGSDHLATNGDELLYAQISKLTAASGELLPLVSPSDRLGNTKPPLLFWQGILSTGWGDHWKLALLRAPNVIYTLLTAGLLVVIGRLRLGNAMLGLQAALLFLCFFSTYRYGRVFLTSAPETFWLFLPLALLLLHREPRLPEGLLWPWVWGGMIGVGLLYKSFALLVPVIATMALWQLRARGWRLRGFVILDAWRLAFTAGAALLFFGLWFWMDPEPMKVVREFVLRENAGKFDAGGGSYLINLFWGQSSLWRIAVSYPLNAGLLAPAVLAVAVDAWMRRHRLGSFEVFLWIWMLVLAAFFCLPNQRDERYLIPAMPALALLLALRLGHLPRWVSLLSVIAGAVILAGITGLAFLLQQTAGIGRIYPLWAMVVPAGGFLLAAWAITSGHFTRPLLPAVLLTAYLGYTAFLIPLDRGPGRFTGEGLESVSGETVWVPANFNSREESYAFLLPGAVVKPYDHKGRPPAAAPFAVISTRLDQPAPDGVILARRLNMIDRFDARETRDILMGNVTRNLFRWDWLVQQR
jgi:4-amino-4-deoxy-L-arabinose transferase-like glycosyltransferase